MYRCAAFYNNDKNGLDLVSDENVPRKKILNAKVIHIRGEYFKKNTISFAFVGAKHCLALESHIRHPHNGKHKSRTVNFTRCQCVFTKCVSVVNGICRKMLSMWPSPIHSWWSKLDQEPFCLEYSLRVLLKEDRQLVITEKIHINCLCLLL